MPDRRRNIFQQKSKNAKKSLGILSKTGRFFRTNLAATLNSQTCSQIDVRGAYVTPELNNELQCNVGNMWEKFTLYLYALKTA